MWNRGNICNMDTTTLSRNFWKGEKEGGDKAEKFNGRRRRKEF